MLKKLRKTTSSMHVVYWESIKDMPLKNWIKCSDGEVQYVCKSGTTSLELCMDQWSKLYDEYLSFFGLGDRYEKYLNTQKDLAVLQAEYVIKKEKFTLTLIEIQKATLKNLENYFGNGQQIEVILLWLGKFMGFRIDPEKVSVMEYFTMLEEYGKANKKVGNS